jgi:hypothetical protein
MYHDMAAKIISKRRQPEYKGNFTSFSILQHKCALGDDAQDSRQQHLLLQFFYHVYLSLFHLNDEPANFYATK